MKRYVNAFLVTLTLFVAGTLSAQEVKLGITVTPTFSFSASDNNTVSSSNGDIGILYGLMADYIFGDSDRYAIFTGLTVHHTAASFKGQSGDYKIATSILEIPASFKLSSNYVDNSRFYGQFGMNLGIPVSDKVKEGPEDNIDVRGVLAAINMGLGWQYDFSTDGVVLNLGVYFNNGFTNVIEVEGQKFRLKHLGLRAGLYF